MEGLHGTADSDPPAKVSNSAPQNLTAAARSSQGSILGGAAPAYSSAGSLGFGDSMTGAKSYPGAAYPRADASPGAAARPVAHLGGVFSGAFPLARGEGKKRATTDEGHGEWKKLKGDPPLREKEQHILVDGFAPCFAGKQVSARDVGQGEEASEGAEGEDEQVGAGDVGQGEEASEGTEGENEQVSEDSASLTSGSWSDTATDSWKGRKDRLFKIMEDILETVRACSAVANKFMLGECMRESIKKVMALVVDCGAAEGSIEHFMATKIFVKAGYRDMFLTMAKEGRLGWLKRWCQEEGTEGEDEQGGGGDVGQGEEASEGTEGEDEQVSEDSASLTSGSWSDTATSSWKGRKDLMAAIRRDSYLAVAAVAGAAFYSDEFSAQPQWLIKIMERILETLRAKREVANKLMLGEHRRESIKKVMGLVVDCGAAEGSVEHFMATKLFVKDGYRAVFLTMTTKEGRLGWLRRWCRMKGLLEA